MSYPVFTKEYERDGKTVYQAEHRVRMVGSLDEANAYVRRLATIAAQDSFNPNVKGYTIHYGGLSRVVRPENGRIVEVWRGRQDGPDYVSSDPRARNAVDEYLRASKGA